MRRHFHPFSAIDRRPAKAAEIPFQLRKKTVSFEFPVFRRPQPPVRLPARRLSYLQGQTAFAFRQPILRGGKTVGAGRHPYKEAPAQQFSECLRITHLLAVGRRHFAPLPGHDHHTEQRSRNADGQQDQQESQSAAQ
ncbi:hypothetical protein [Neisseria elongata]|uniref:hypothetical protein n=1 Tax=Neisseria elongata TaxID=495 RepID=UPI00066696A9|nr:hypothetical protein [Neisseria elongata]